MPTLNLGTREMPQAAQWVTIGSLSPGTYAFQISGTVAWEDAATPQPREANFNLAIDVDGFDNQGRLVETWNSGIFVRITDKYQTSGGPQTRPLNYSGQTSPVPGSLASVRVMVLDQSGPSGGQRVGPVRIDNLVIVWNKV